MASMTVQAMRDYVRDVLDIDSDELSDSILDVWRDEGTSHIERMFEPWLFYEASYTLSIATATTSFTTIGATLETIRSVVGENWMLKHLPHEHAAQKYAWGDPTGTPREWSTWGSTLYLWPTPDATVSYTIRGVRTPVAATSASDVVDLPVEFHPLISEWMLARAYERDDDDVMSQLKFNRVDQQLDSLKRRYTRTSNAGIGVVGELIDADNNLPSRLVYDWE